eukprot:TRINITY_DN11238_c0_g1_i1.p1 TRINITY_DN11238_c0_g1~~TRINITY_DN11238_c0_g1_i1.p1  ORF type:complete len:597 (+),score=113.64 TRINITY_DN11238_c0_g1_i1:70-1791(+)
MLALGGALAALAAAAAHRGTKPHIVYVLVDDWGWADAGWHRPPGQADGVETPVLDRLVREGVELDRLYVYKMCSPTRTALQSGRNPIHASVVNTKETYRNPDDPVSGWSAMPRNMTGLGEVMARGGYHTHFYGKWDAGMATPQHTPLGRGYRKSLFYFHHQNDYWTMATQPNESDAGDTTCPGFPSDRGPVDLWEDDHPAWGLNNSAECSQVHQDGCVFEDQLFAERVYSAIRTHDVSAPLFLFWAMHAVHQPLEAPQRFIDRWAKYGPPAGRWERQHYLALVGWVDEAVGNATALLKARGMWSSTLLILHSDNGGPIYQHGTAGGNNWPLKGGKESNWEGGIRANAFAAGGVIPPQARGTKVEGLAAGWDWYATLAALAGVDPTDARAAAAGLPPIDSYDLWPMIAGINKTSPRPELPIGTDGLLIGIGTSMEARVGGLIRGRYKLLLQSIIPMSGWTGPVFPNTTSNWDADYALHLCGPTVFTGCLYDIYADPSERRNIARESPQIWRELHHRVKELQQTTFSPHRGKQDPAACDMVAGRYRGFWGPWAFLDTWADARARAEPAVPGRPAH